MLSAFLNKSPDGAAAGCQLPAAANPGLMQETLAAGSRIPSPLRCQGSEPAAPALGTWTWTSPASASHPAHGLVQAKRQPGCSGSKRGDRNPGKKGSSPPVTGETSPRSRGLPPSSPSPISEPLLLPLQSHFRAWEKLRAWKRWGSEGKTHCPIILVSVKDPFFYIYIHTYIKKNHFLYVYIYVCVSLTSTKHFAIYIQKHLYPLLEVPPRFNTTAGQSPAPLRDNSGQFRG